MQCGIYNKDSDYHWEKKDEQIHLRVQGVSSHELNIINLKPDDSGEYRCAMSNSTGNIFSDYSLITVKGWLIQIIGYMAIQCMFFIAICAYTKLIDPLCMFEMLICIA